MTAGKRMALAFSCMLFSLLLLCGMSFCSVAIRYGLRSALPALEMMPVFLLFAIPGWVLALPFVLLFRNAAWAILAIGVAIGPLFLGGWSLLAAGGIHWKQDGFGLLMSLIIGTITVVSYVVLLRRMARDGRPAAGL